MSFNEEKGQEIFGAWFLQGITAKSVIEDPTVESLYVALKAAEEDDNEYPGPS